MNSASAQARPAPHLPLVLAAIGALWAAAVTAAAASGALLRVPLPWIAALVATSIALPTAAYFASAALRGFVESVGQRRLMALHLWRVPAALLFFWYGAQGLLPPLFWVLAGVGDLIAGSYAAVLLRRRPQASEYRSFHRFGFADFVVAVGTGLAFTLAGDPRMATIVTLPMALIPLFGVGLSGASHLVAFDLLRRGAGFEPPAPR